MKKHVLFVLALVAGFSGFSQFRFGPAVEVAIPTGDFAEGYSLGYGLSARTEYGVGDHIGIGFQLGYIMLSPKDEAKDLIKSAAMIPAQLIGKYYFSEQQNGAYAGIVLGLHNLSITTKDIDLGFLGVDEGESDSEAYLSYGLGAGYVLNNKIDLNVRYNLIAPDSDFEDAKASTYIGVSVAYLLGGE